MGTALITLKVMPVGVDVDLEDLKNSIKEKVEAAKGQQVNFTEEPVAFGLKAVLASFSLDESIELDPIENQVGEIEEVNSVVVADMRRAFG